MAQGKRKHRRKLIALALFCGLVAAAAFVAHRYFLNGERLRHLAEAAVVKYTGIEMHIGTFEATLVPARVVATGVRLSVPEATATADRVEVRVDLSRLHSREIAITTGDISGLVVHLPEDPAVLVEVIDRVEQHAKETGGGGDGKAAVSVAIAEITAAAHVYLGDDPELFAATDLRIDDILSARVGIHADAVLAAWGDAARLYGDVELLRAEPGSPWQADGTAWLTAVQTERLPLKNSPEGVFGAGIFFAPTDAGPGAEVHARLDAPGHPEITGEIEAGVVWTGKHVDVQRVAWEAAGAQLEGSGAIASAADWSLNLREARASEAALDALLALLEQPRARFEADPGAQVIVADLAVDSLNGEWRVDRGDLDFAGLTIVSALDGPARDGIAQATRGLRGTLSAKNGLIAVHEIRNDDLSITGIIEPDRTNNTVRTDLRGVADLARMPWTLLNDRGDVEHVQGKLAVTRFAATFAAGAGVPEDLTVEAELRDAAIRYIDHDLSVDLKNITGHLATSGREIIANLSASDLAGNPVAVAGNYEVKSHLWTGTFETDPRTLVPELFDRSTYLDDLRILAHTVGPSVFDMTVEFPSNTKQNLRATLTRRESGDTALVTRLEFDKTVTAFSVESTLPAPRIFEKYLPRLRGDGTVHATFSYDGLRETFSFAADATDCSIASDSLLRKDAGTGLTLRAAGNAGKNWTLDSVEAAARGEPFITLSDPAKDGSHSVEVQLAALPALLPAGATASGAIRGRLHLDGSEGQIAFADAALALDPTLSLDRVHGRIAFSPESFTCENLELHGARSDCTFALTRQAGRWAGRASGIKLDLEAILHFIDAARALQPRAEDDLPPAAGIAPPSLWAKPMLGEFTLDLGEVHHRRGQLNAVHFRVLGEERAIRLTEFSARYGDGSVLGSLVIVPGETTDAVVKSAMKWTQLDGRVLNDMFFPKDQGFFGVFDGELTFDAPLGTSREMMAAGNGSARFTGKNGSLGQIGFASKLLTVLKTTEIINLKAPTLRDKGLVFNTLGGGLALVNGHMTLNDIALDGGAYTISSEGTVDFAKDETNADAFVRVLESVGRIMKKVPLIGDVVAALSTDLIGVPVHFSGSPYDVQVGVAGATGKSVATAPVRAGEGAVKAVGEGFKRLIPGGNDKKNDTPK